MFSPTRSLLTVNTKPSTSERIFVLWSSLAEQTTPKRITCQAIDDDLHVSGHRTSLWKRSAVFRPLTTNQIWFRQFPYTSLSYNISSCRPMTRS